MPVPLSKRDKQRICSGHRGTRRGAGCAPRAGAAPRDLITAIGLGANRPQDAVYPTSRADVDGRKYSGANKYVMRFPKGHLPPAEGFWSLTMYGSSYFFVSNLLNRCLISPRQNLKTNPDGSTELYIQHESPGKDKESN